MFWNSRVTILFITPLEIRSAVFASNGKVTKEGKLYAWDHDTLSDVLKDISSRGPSRARAVFGEDFSYVTSFELEDRSRGAVLDRAKESIPDELDGNWDFKQSNGTDFSSQVAAIEHRYLNDFSGALSASGLEVEAIEPQSISIARLLPQTGLFLFITKYENVLMGVVKNGVVITTYVAKEQEAISAMEKFIPYIKNKYQAVPEKVFVDNGINPHSEVFAKNNLEAEACDLNPLRGMALKKDIAGQDALVLNINPEKAEIVQEKKKENKPSVSRREKILATLLITFLIIAGLIIFLKMR